MISALERWTLLADFAENGNRDALRQLRARIAEEKAAAKPRLFVVPREPEQLDLFTEENQREVETVMTDILERRPKVG